MHVHRAVACCPYCNEEAEVWYYKGKIEPLSSIQCTKCSTLYDPSIFITKLLYLYKTETVSTYTINAI